MADRDAAGRGLLHAEAKRARLADHADGAGTGERDVGGGHEGDASAAGVIVHADTVRTDERHSGGVSDLGQANLLGDAVRQSGFRIA